jgi:hypothetical protein
VIVIGAGRASSLLVPGGGHAEGGVKGPGAADSAVERIFEYEGDESGGDGGENEEDEIDSGGVEADGEGCGTSCVFARAGCKRAWRAAVSRSRSA